ncbi:phosphoribosyltransferase-like protein [Lactifluus subvellereus]|nr:phosphoribosyltransferase-like protein [Lactifluus subvellereus]
MSDVAYIKTFLNIHSDFPKKGVAFCDIFPLFRNPLAFEALITHLIHRLTSYVIPTSPNGKIDVIVGLDARGFLLGPVIALRLGAAFVPVRKVGKLPGECVHATYEKEYGTDEFEMQADSIAPGQTVVIVDDIIATGGSAVAAEELVAKQGGNVLQYLFIAEVTFLKGAAKLNAPVYSMVQLSDERTQDERTQDE